jgi:tight adherence protein B
MSRLGSRRLRAAALVIGLASASVLGAASAGAAATTADTTSATVVGHTATRADVVLDAGTLSAGQSLDPKSVHVTVDGRRVAATAVTSTPAGSATLPQREAILVLDTSGSMRGSGIAAAKAAALTFAARVPADVRIALVTFAGRPTVLLAPTTDRSGLRAALDHVAAGGNTSLYDGILAAASLPAPAGTLRRLVVLSDGNDTVSRHSLHDAESTLSAAHVVVDVIRFRGGSPALDGVAASSGGRVLPASDAGTLATAFSAAAKAFTARAEITVSLPASAAGHTVQIAVSMQAGARTVAAAPVAVAVPSVPAPAHTVPTSRPASARAVAAAGAGTVWSPSLIIALVTAFVAIFAIVLVAAWTPVAGARVKQRRARLAEVGRYRLIGARDTRAADGPDQALLPSQVTSAALNFADRAVQARGTRQKIVDSLDRAGLRMRAEEWVVLQLSAVLISAAAFTAVLRSPLGMLIGAGLGYLGLRAFVSIKTSRRATAFSAQLPDMLQLLAGSVRSGFSMTQAVAGVVNEGAEPVASEFARALTEVRLGADLEDALDEVAQRMDSLDLHLVLLAVRTSREVGGNLAEVLMTTAETMRERSQLKGQVRVLSAEGRMSAQVLIALPFLILGYLIAFRPQYLHPLVSTGLGWALVAAGSTLLVVGAVWIRRMVRMEV